MKQGYADIVLGLQFGDEGKARVIDTIAKDYNIIARFNGGSNAGHTIEHGDKRIALHQVPSGIFYSDKILYIGSGCVVNIVKLVKEIRGVTDLGIDLSKRLKISSQATIVQPHHEFLDGKLGRTVGTLGEGIGPTYADRAMRMYGERLVNIRLGDLFDDPKRFFDVIEQNLKAAFPDETFDRVAFSKAFNELKQYIELDPLYITKQVENGAKVLFEGAQSVMLDVVKGSIPFVTSSITIGAGAYSGGDLSPKYHRKIIGVVKAIMSRVGYGPFPSEFGGRKSEKYTLEPMSDGNKVTKATEKKLDVDSLISSKDPFEMGIGLRIFSGEYGATSGRPRRIGALDLVLLNHTVKMNGIDDLVITKCDVLREYSQTAMRKMPIVTGYKLDGKTIDYVPGATSAFYRVQPAIKERPGFSEDISNVRSFAKLPKQVKDFVKEIEKASGCKVIGLGVGPKRDQFVHIK